MLYDLRGIVGPDVRQDESLLQLFKGFTVYGLAPEDQLDLIDKALLGLGKPLPETVKKTHESPLVE
jgi:hypothetical protein